MLLLLIGLAATTSTAVGGLFAVKYRDRLHLILGFSAGAVMAVALLDLLGESIELGQGTHDTLTVVAVAVAGSLLYMAADRSMGRPEATARGGRRGHLGAASLTVHSFLDGLGIGLAFSVSFKVGVPVAVAVLAHDFSDGINTVNLSLVGGLRRRGALGWLVADAAAPLGGIGAAQLIRIPAAGLSIVLALFSGFFLYIGWSELSPESYHRHPKAWTTLSTVLGAAAMYAIIRIAG